MLKAVATTKPYQEGRFRELEENLEVDFEDTEHGWGLAHELFVDWANWIREGQDHVLNFANRETLQGWSIRPVNVLRVALIFEADE